MCNECVSSELWIPSVGTKAINNTEICAYFRKPCCYFVLLFPLNVILFKSSSKDILQVFTLLNTNAKVLIDFHAVFRKIKTALSLQLME